MYGCGLYLVANLEPHEVSNIVWMSALDATRMRRSVFQGAADMAARGRGYSYFVWCLLELQKNVQTQED